MIRILVIIFLTIFSQLILVSCTNPESSNDTPPSITITFPQNNSMVSEVVKITCVATDNEGISKVELWVDGVSTGVTDDTEPYALDWNTTTYNDSTVHTITVRAYDVNDNKTDSDPILLTIDNSNSNPHEINIISIVFEGGHFTITWNQSKDGDFKSYQLEKSDEPTMINYDVIYTTNELTDTTFKDRDVSPLVYHYYRITITDSLGYETKGQIFVSSLDPPPDALDITSVTYTFDEMMVTWEESIDSDFKNYKLLYSETETGSRDTIVTYGDRLTTLHLLTDFDPTHENWFWVMVTDTFDQSSIGDGLSNSINGPPIQSIIYDIIYQNNSFHISWSMNHENDFLSYSLYESFDSAMNNEYLIYQTNNRADTNFVITGVDTNEIRYYRLRVTDYWNQETLSSIKGGSSYSIPTSLVLVSGGTFIMGDTWGDGDPDELPTHSVTLSSFYIGKFEVTQTQWKSIMGTNPSSFQGENHPVERITWFEVLSFCNSLSLQEGLTPCYTINGNNVTWNSSANGYRLPTEAEWEYAVRGGNLSQNYKFSGSNTPENVAWYSANSGSGTHDVGTKQLNELGIYDMSGNVWEFCWDWYGNYSASSQINPTGPSSGTDKVVRGGAFYESSHRIRVSERGTELPNSQGGSDYIGFRIVRSF